MFDPVDIVLIVLFLLLNGTLYGFTFFGPYTCDGDCFNTSVPTISNWSVMLTHVFVLPSVVIIYKEEPWFVVVLLHSLITSVCYHVARIYDVPVESDFERWDVAAQNLLVTSTFFLLLFEKIPKLANYVMVGLAIFIAAMGQIKIGESGLEIFEGVGGLFMLGVFLYLILRTVKPIYIRDNKYILLACLAALVACLTFVLATNNDNETDYALVHSMWHVSAYIMLFFAIKSIQREYQPLRCRRELN
jgi:hypothetical protein